ncbi:hypothetical protein [Desulforamulus aeronauticus]|uniref:Uncharacterized protein n=1 Tax=Desulforamulus aeronauticus DSM 10349 TaxID=1121421 RepID=A0A1M6W660_9FIRM|nr:hypothetical protein [Desulforamulus aeronauticus]SHK88965.1 hypothetical protein SAMN02745123_03486 [Desulforamulus aeronauticus DSM 10349]
MNKELLKLPLCTLAAGIILRTADYITVRLLIRGTTEWTLEMGTTAFYVRLFLSVSLFAGIGLLLRKRYSRITFIKSATLLMLYSVVIFAIEQVTQHFGSYSMIIYYLYIPVDMFTVITSFLARISDAGSINWLYAIPSLFAPYLFLLFSKKSASQN